MNDIFKENKEAHGYLSKLSLEAWARHAFDPRVKSDHITNIMTESFNHWIGELRAKPILTLVESLVVKLMGKLHVRYENGCTLETNVAPKIKKKLNQIQNSARFCSLVPAGQMEFAVTDNNGDKFAVNLETKECQCRFWLISGLPCKHAVACMVYLRHDLESYCEDYYSKNAYQQTYNEIIHPVHDLKMVEMYETPGDIILPPVLRRLPGRPKKKRTREVDEGKPGDGKARRSNTVKCDNCKEFGHNRRTCQRAPVAAKRKYVGRKASGVTQEESIIVNSSAFTEHSQASKNITATRNKEKRKTMISDATRRTTNESRRYLRRNVTTNEGPDSGLNVTNIVERTQQLNASQATTNNARGTTSIESRWDLKTNATAGEGSCSRYNVTNNVEGNQQLNASQATSNSTNATQAKGMRTSEYAPF